MSLIHRALKEVEGETARGTLPPVGMASAPRRWPQRLAGLAAVAVLGAVSPLLATRLLAPAPESPRPPAAAEAVAVPPSAEQDANQGATGASSPRAYARDPASGTAAPKHPVGTTTANTDGPVGHERVDRDTAPGPTRETPRRGSPEDTAGNANGDRPPAKNGARGNGEDTVVDDAPATVTVEADGTPAADPNAPASGPGNTSGRAAGPAAATSSPATGTREKRTPDGTAANRASRTLNGEALERAHDLYARMMQQVAADEWQAAEDTLNEVATLLPAGNILRLRMEAWFAFRREDYDRAGDRYRQILERFPGDEEAGINLAYIHLRQGERDRAREVLKSVRRHAPDSETLERAARRLGM